jgi:hypothetical protein
MARHWSFKEDMFLARHFDAVGDWCGEHDLGRPKLSATRRVAKLKGDGLWTWLQDLIKAETIAYSNWVLVYSRDQFLRDVAHDDLTEIDFYNEAP